MEELLRRMGVLLSVMPSTPEVRGAYDLLLAMEERVESLKAESFFENGERIRRLLERA